MIQPQLLMPIMRATDATPVLSGLTGSMWRTHHAVPRVLPSSDSYVHTPLVMLAPADNGGQGKPSRFAARPPGAMANMGIMGLPVRTHVLPHTLSASCAFPSATCPPSSRQDNMGDTKQQRTFVGAQRPGRSRSWRLGHAPSRHALVIGASAK